MGTGTGKSADWERVGHVKPSDAARGVWTDTAHIYRIVTAGGEICAPNLHTMGYEGELVKRDRVSKQTVRSVGVFVDPLSSGKP